MKAQPEHVPTWVPMEVQNYISHAELGHPIRSLARAQSCHASTIMRQVRKVESRRDDPLVDQAINNLVSDDETIDQLKPLELVQALRRLAMPDAMLAIAIGMDQGMIVNTASNSDIDHGATVPCRTAQYLALRNWIVTANTEGRVLRYRITPAGRTALRELIARSENQARALAEAPAGFKGAPEGVGTWQEQRAMLSRAPTMESPVAGLARRRGKDGAPFLNRAMVRAAERLREDFEIAQVSRYRGEQEVLNWANAITPGEGEVETESAEGQLRAALAFLGPGLIEIALRCCCFLEGLEVTERHMGWAARSGKVVLRIALQRLVLHYEGMGKLGPRIG